MAEKGEPQGRRLDDRTYELFNEFLSDFRELLQKEASQEAEDRPINAEDLEAAFSRLVGGSRKEAIDTQRVITTALKENRIGEGIAYGMSAVLFVFGLMFLACGTARGEYPGVLAGAAVEVVLLFPLRFAMNIRRHNIAIRILGKLLDRVKDPRTLAAILKETFPDVIRGKSNLPRRGA